MTQPPVIAIRGLGHTYGEGALKQQVLYDIDLNVAAGEMVILTGPSGSGKTTLLTLCGALRSVQTGNVQILGMELKGADTALLNRVRARIGFIFQAHHLMNSLTARQNVALALGLDLTMSPRERRERAADMLRTVGLEDRLDYYPKELSGGQKQRVAVARALVRTPSIILADEPTASLDRHSGREVVDLLRQTAHGKGCAIILVTHDARILDIADRKIHLEDGRLVELSAGAAQGEHSLTLLLELQRKGKIEQTVHGFSRLELRDFLEAMIPWLACGLDLFEPESQPVTAVMLKRFLLSALTRIAALLHASDWLLWRFDVADGTMRPYKLSEEALSALSVEALNHPRPDHSLDVWGQSRSGALIGGVRFVKKTEDPIFEEQDIALLQSLEKSLGVLLETCIALERQAAERS